MSRWLVVLGAALFITAVHVNAQSARGFADPVARGAASSVIDIRLSQPLGAETATPMIRELLVNRRVAGNAAIGLGLADFYSRRKRNSDGRLGDGTTPKGRKPAVTF